MLWGLIFLSLSILVAFGTGDAFAKNEDGPIKGLGIIATILFAVFGAFCLYCSGTGEISHPFVLQKKAIYKVVKQVPTIIGTVVIVETGDKKIWSTWSEKETLPPDTKWVRIGANYQLEPADIEEPAAEKPDVAKPLATK